MSEPKNHSSDRVTPYQRLKVAYDELNRQHEELKARLEAALSVNSQYESSLQNAINDRTNAERESDLANSNVTILTRAVASMQQRIALLSTGFDHLATANALQRDALSAARGHWSFRWWNPTKNYVASICRDAGAFHDEAVKLYTNSRAPAVDQAGSIQGLEVRGDPPAQYAAQDVRRSDANSQQAFITGGLGSNPSNDRLPR